MKTYTKLIKQKVHWLHLTAATLVIGAFTAVSLQQYAAQSLYSDIYSGTSDPVAMQALHQAGVKKQYLRIINGQKSATEPIPVAPAEAPTAQTSQPAAKATAPATAAKPKTSAAAAPKPTPAPTSEIASESACPGQGSTANTASVLVCMSAYARAYHGKVTISANSALMTSAAAKAQDMANCGYSHTACGRAFNYWFAPSGYTGLCGAENIAKGQTTPGQVFVAWMNSAGHRANILNATYKHIGVAFTPSGGNLWVMQLGGC